MTRLIYHPLDAPANTVSPIDATILDLVSSQSIKLACPYIGLRPLQRVVDRCTNWRLVTDVRELVVSQGPSERKEMVDFLRHNASSVRHCLKLHAKVVIAGQQALVGSANLTISGLSRRNEMSVLLSDQSSVNELGTWFDNLWDQCSRIDSELVADFEAALPTRSSSMAETIPFPMPPGPQVRSNLVPVTEMRRGRWTKESYLSVVAEKWPDLLHHHEALIKLLNDSNATRYSGNGPKEPTYHAVLPNTDTDVFWIYAHGSIYARWSKLRTPAALRFKDLVSDLIDTNHPDGSEKSDGCHLKGGIENIEPERIVQIILSIADSID